MVQIRCTASVPGVQLARPGLTPRISRLPQAPCNSLTDRQCRPAPWAPAAPTQRAWTARHQPQPRKTATFAASVSAPTAENILGRAFLTLLPGVTYYLASFAIPATVCLAAWGATHSAAILTALTGQPAALQSAFWVNALSVLLSLTTAITFFVVAPLGDLVLGRDLRDLQNPKGAERVQRGPLLYRLPLYAYLPVHFATLAYAMHAACTAHLSAAAFVGLAFSMGVSGAVFFTVAHELLHGTKEEQLLSSMLLATAGYMHWAAAHKYHHINVGTPEDPTTARRDEPLWAYLPRCIGGNLRSGYQAEARRLQALGISPLSAQNRAIWWVAVPTLLAGAAFCAYGWSGVAFLAMWSAVAIWCVETVNYIEHYGLVREKLPNGRYEHVAPKHSWTAGDMFTNAAAFRLERHADHHMAARKHYQFLVDYPDAPQLPADYSLLILLACVPPLFFKLMNPLLDDIDAAQAASATAPLGAIVSS